MGDLISRKALLEAYASGKAIRCYDRDVASLIHSAPAVEQGEAEAVVNECLPRSGYKEIPNGDLIYFSSLNYWLTATSELLLPEGTKLYTTPPKPQSVKDALEKAAKICDENAKSFAPKSTIIDTPIRQWTEGARESALLAAKQIRALIEDAE